MEKKEFFCVICRFGGRTIYDEPCRSCINGLGSEDRWESDHEDEEEDEE